jgi:hypothetical protein
MIIRIATEGQYRASGALLDKLNRIDNQLVEALTNKDESTFQRLLSDMLALVRGQGEPLPVEELVESDLILPAPGTTLEEARSLFLADGLIPG